jgi:hypothetical protein
MPTPVFNGPSTVQGGQTQVITSAFDFLNFPAVDPSFTNVTRGEADDIFNFERMGVMKKLNAQSKNHSELSRAVQSFLVASSTTQASVFGQASGGATVGYVEENRQIVVPDNTPYIILDSSYCTPSVDVGNIKANSCSYPRVRNVLNFPGGNVFYIVAVDKTTPGVHKFYLQSSAVAGPSGSYTQLLAYMTSTKVGSTWGGQNAACQGIVSTESPNAAIGSIIPGVKNINSKLFTPVGNFKNSNQEQFQFIYQGEFFNTTKNAMEKINFFYDVALQQEEMRFRKAVSQQISFGATNVSGVTDAEGKPLVSSEGWITTVENAGTFLQRSDTPSMALFQQFNNYKKKLQQLPDSAIYCGYKAIQEINLAMSAFLVNGGTIYDREDLNVNVRTVDFANNKYQIVELAVLGDPYGMGLPGFAYPEYMIVAPIDKQQAYISGEEVLPLEIMYAPQMQPLQQFRSDVNTKFGYVNQDWIKTWTTGGNADVPNTNVLERNYNFAAQVGAKLYGASRFIWSTK